MDNIVKRVTIVTVLHNSAAVIEQCLLSIPSEIGVFIVDNASRDGCSGKVATIRPSAKIIKSKKNIGFGRGNNLALEKIATEFALVLNPDTIIQQDTLEKLLEAAGRYPDAAIIAPTLRYADGSFQKSYKTSVFQREKIKAKYIEPSGDLCAECLSGAAMLLRMSVFNKIGFFDPDIFLFYEDDDLCLKAKESGYSSVLTPNATITHLMGKSSPPTFRNVYFKNWHMMWSRLYLEKKYKGSDATRILAIKEFFLQSGKTVGHLLTLKPEKTVKSLARLIAVIGFCLGVKAFR
ncbi:MAG: glycosyltransferase family 2 protein [Rickettsiaceae bacterium]|nr:glycosyltransferase family 2 protein [Rickettsiaceae bacterium]